MVAVVSIKGDNITALTAAAKLKCTASPLLGREFSMIYTASLEPRVVEHLPGAMNGMSDALSRLEEPGAPKACPSELANVPRAYPPLRTPAYDLTLAA